MPSGLKWVLVFLLVFGVGFTSGYKARDYKLLKDLVVANKADQKELQSNLEANKDAGEKIQQAEDRNRLEHQQIQENDIGYTDRIIKLGYDGVQQSAAEARIKSAEDSAAATTHQLKLAETKIRRLSKELRRVTNDYRKESKRADGVVVDFNQCSTTLKEVVTLYDKVTHSEANK